MNPIDQVTEQLGLTAQERAFVEETVNKAAGLAEAAGYRLDDQARLALGAHLGSLDRRLRTGEKVTGIDAALFDEVPREFQQTAVTLLQPIYDRVQQQMDPIEVGLVALHFGAAKERFELAK